MGHRLNNSDNYGAFLEWNAELGARVESAPKGWVSVYREVSSEELVRISQQGLTVPAPEMRPPEVRLEMETLDRFRPRHLMERGVSRLGAIYAAPTIEDAPRLPFRRERVVLELKVDAGCGWVGDMDFITCLIPFLGAHGQGAEKFHGAFRKYWESVIPLKRFLRDYARLKTGDGNHWVAKGRLAAGVPRVFFAPEIMLTTSAVNQRHIRVVNCEPLHEEEQAVFGSDDWGDY
jgi:hypothetical protein